MKIILNANHEKKNLREQSTFFPRLYTECPQGYSKLKASYVNKKTCCCS